MQPTGTSPHGRWRRDGRTGRGGPPFVTEANKTPAYAGSCGEQRDGAGAVLGLGHSKPYAFKLSGAEVNDFETFNRNKSSVALDLRSRGPHRLRGPRSRFGCGVLQPAWRPAGKARASLRGSRPCQPEDVCVSLSGFGTTGPRAGEGAYNVTNSALEGSYVGSDMELTSQLSNSEDPCSPRLDPSRTLANALRSETTAKTTAHIRHKRTMQDTTPIPRSSLRATGMTTAGQRGRGPLSRRHCSSPERPPTVEGDQRADRPQSRRKPRSYQVTLDGLGRRRRHNTGKSATNDIRNRVSRRRPSLRRAPDAIRRE